MSPWRKKSQWAQPTSHHLEQLFTPVNGTLHISSDIVVPIFMTPKPLQPMGNFGLFHLASGWTVTLVFHTPKQRPTVPLLWIVWGQTQQYDALVL